MGVGVSREEKGMGGIRKRIGGNRSGGTRNGGSGRQVRGEMGTDETRKGGIR